MKALLISLLLLSTSVVAEEAPQATKCGSRDAITKQMMRGGSSPVVLMQADDSLVEVWQHKGGWTLFQSSRDGQMCELGSGAGKVHMATPRCIDPVRCPAI